MMSLIASISPSVLIPIIAAVLSFGCGWQIQGWRLGSEISSINESNAKAVSDASQAALSDYMSAANSIKLAAESANMDMASLNAKLSDIQKRVKNAPPPPLPVDCRPGPVRLRNLSETSSAIDQAISGSELSK